MTHDPQIFVPIAELGSDCPFSHFHLVSFVPFSFSISTHEIPISYFNIPHSAKITTKAQRLGNESRIQHCVHCLHDYVAKGERGRMYNDEVFVIALRSQLLFRPVGGDLKSSLGGWEPAGDRPSVISLRGTT